MTIKEKQERILKAVKEARKLLQKENSVSGDGLGGVTSAGANATGETPVSDGLTANTAQKETLPPNQDQVGLVNGKLREKDKKGDSNKAVIPLRANQKVPKGFIQPKKGIKYGYTF